MNYNFDVLHLEDDKSDAFLIEKSLKSSPNPICNTIKNVQKLSDGLRELQLNQYGVVLLDLNLTDVSGLDNLRCLKEECPEIPIIVITGTADEKVAKQALIEGAQEYLFKGHSSPDILKRVITSSVIRKEVENELVEKLYYDSMTSLPNRLFFKQIVETLINKAKRRDIRESLFFIDLDFFKHVNDTYGHAAGNHVLRVTSDRMKNVLRSSDVIARYAGDEFVIYLDGKKEHIDEADCAQIAEKIIHAIEEPIEYKGYDMKISASIGISMFPCHGDNYADLIDASNKAMYLAKGLEGFNYAFARKE